MRGAYFAALTFALWIFLVRLPVAPGVTVDPSWQEVLIRAHTQAWQFGRDIIFTYGPWGFLLGNCHLGQEGAVARLAWELAGQLGLAIAVIRLTRELAPWRQVGLVAAIGFFHGRVFTGIDAFYLAFIALVVIRRLMAAAGSRWTYFLWATLLGFLSQFKLNYGAVAACGLVAAASLAVVQQRRPVAGAIVVGGVAGFLTTWLAAGQALGNLWSYAVAGWEIIRGNDGMALDEARGAFLIGLGLVLLIGVFLWRLWHRRPALTERTALVGFLAAVWFIAWKHGYTRADPWHLPGFSLLTLYLALVLPGFYFRRKDADWFDGCGALCLFILLTGPIPAVETIQDAPVRWIANVRALAGIADLPARWQAELKEKSGSLGSAQLPGLIGSHSIDAYNFNQAEVVLQPVHYAPRPVFQGYLANTARLIGWNRSYYESERAPDFILWRQLTIDGRYPTQDDAGLFQIVKRRYAVAGSVAGATLLQKRPVAVPAPGATTPLLTRTLALGEVCVLPPAVARDALWLRATPVPSLLGRLRAFAYKPAQLFLATGDTTQGRRLWRIVPRVAGSGFLLQPRLETGADFVAYMAGRALPPMGPFSFIAPDGQEKFWRGIEIELTAEPLALPAP